MRPGEPPTLETAESLFGGLFFDPERYDLSAVGRVNAAMALEGLNRDDPKYITFVQHFQRVREAPVAESR